MQVSKTTHGGVVGPFDIELLFGIPTPVGMSPGSS